MSEPLNNESSAPAAEDRISNLQKEFTRKFSNVEEKLKASNEQLLAQLQTMLKPAPAPSTKESSDDLEQLMYTKPAEAVRRIKDEAKNEMRAEFDSREQETLKRNTVINSLYNEFPELGVQESDLYKSAISKYNDMAKEYGHTPAVYKAAVAEAALDLGLKPRSKRPASDNDDFSFSGSSSSGGRSRGRESSDKLHPLTIETAKLMGVDPDRIKKRVAGRKNFGKWE